MQLGTVRRYVYWGAIGCCLMVVSGCGTKTAQTGTAAVDASMAPGTQALADKTAPVINTEQYDHVVENGFVAALEQPLSTFSIDVDTAAYANIRRLLREGTTPPSGAVRIEELVNYFSYDYPQPDAEHPFSVHTELATCPWAEDHQLLRIGLQATPIDFAERPGCNLVFLLDVSGSMVAPNKLPLVKSAMQMLLHELKPNDRVALVVYAGAAGVVLDSTAVQQSDHILAALEQLTAGGSTNGGQGIELAYRIAADNFIAQGINRVILCTDGDFNVGTSSDSALVKLIETQAKSQIYLSVLGFGSGNLKDSKMEKLADHGNGNYAYIDSLLEARKVLVEQIGGTLMTVAKDVKIQLDFNPRHVQAYRLIGYENRLLQNQDFRNDQRDAGEIGAGHSVTAFYELVPAGVDATNSTPRTSEFVQPRLADSDASHTLLTVNLRYKLPEADDSCEFQVRVDADSQTAAPSGDFQFATAVVAFGLLLRDSPYAGSADWEWVIETARQHANRDASGLRGEFVRLAETAQLLAGNSPASP